MHDLLSELCPLVQRHAGATLPIPGLRILLGTERTRPAAAVYEPLVYFVLQGAKRIVLGSRVLEYGAGSLLVASVDMPVVWQVVDASPSVPYLGVSLELDRAAVASLLLEMPPARSSRPETLSSGLVVGQTSRESVESLLRLVRLLDTPDDIAVLSPLAERELLYRVLKTQPGALVREFARADGRMPQVARAVAWIRGHVTEPLRVDALAEVAGMSRTSLHRHFKVVTGRSPLAYQKELRLQEARCRILAAPGDVAGVAFSVGYESASQFTREYTRHFGAPPARDIARLRSPEGAVRPSLVSASPRRRGQAAQRRRA